MKKILVRGGMSPFDNYCVSDIILNNRFGTNAGNMVYLYSVYRMLLTQDDIQIDVDGYDIERGHIKDKDIEKINEEYSMYIIPLADAFRPSFVELNLLTKAIRRMKIPVVVIGVGMKIDLNTSPNRSFEFDEAVTKFVSAVLDKSSLIGIRGEITGEYLKHLGFHEDKHFTPIGCPSLYLNGNNLKLKRLNEINEQTKIIVNASMLSEESVNIFLRSILDDYSGSVFIPQLVRELREVYLGAIYRKENTAYPVRATDRVFMEDRARFFTNVPAWFNYVSEFNLSIGARMHGNIASINSGVPAVFIVKDGRMKELVDYHKLPHIFAKDISSKTSLTDIIGNLNLYSMEDKHEDNFRHFVDFLNKNNVDNIFHDYSSPEDTEFDRIINKTTWEDPIRPIVVCDENERIRRREEFLKCEDAYIDYLKNRIKLQNHILARYERFIPGFLADILKKNIH